MNIKKTNFAIKRLKEFSLCGKEQNIKYSIDNGNTILEIVCEEVEK